MKMARSLASPSLVLLMQGMYFEFMHSIYVFNINYNATELKFAKPASYSFPAVANHSCLTMRVCRLGCLQIVSGIL